MNSISAENLLLFGTTKYSPALDDMLCAAFGDDKADREKAAVKAVSSILSLAGSTGFYGNLWHILLALVIVSSENSYTLSAELKGAPAGTVRDFALSDLRKFREWFSLDLAQIGRDLGVSELAMLEKYESDDSAGREYSPFVREKICSLARLLADCEDEESMLSAADTFYRECGVGTLGLHKAFRLKTSGDAAEISPIAGIADVKFDDLVGYEQAKSMLRENTEAFLRGAPANNCLLYGDAGTGKSSSIKALANTYYGSGLRIIEIYKHEFRYLHGIIDKLKRRNYKFILYMDDLSFEDHETEYKYLKAVIEGGLEKKPGNVLIYATSNRRHLVRESFKDKPRLEDDDVHRSDTVQEKLSLYDRFGVTIRFGSPTPDEYKEIVRVLAEREGLKVPDDELMLLANRWQLKHAGYSGRTARQLVDHLLGTESGD